MGKDNRLSRTYGRHKGVTTNQNSSHVRRANFDLYETPSIATEELVKAIKLKEPVWEPACGKGAISRVLEDSGLKVISSDLHDHGFGLSGKNFFDIKLKKTGDIVSNPPYDCATEFCERAVLLQKGTNNRVVMLLRLEFLSSKGRKKFLSTSSLEKVLVFSGRLKFKTPNSEKLRGGVNYAWFVWRDGYEGEPKIGWVL